MSELKNPQTELIKLANNILNVRSEINTDKLNGLFTEVSFIHYNILKRIWPELLTSEECPKSKITLKSLYAETELRTSQVSQMAEQLSNNGLVSWERGEVGTYIMLTDYGFEHFKQQERILLSYLDNAVNIIGLERFEEIVSAMGELESALNQAAPTENAG